MKNFLITTILILSLSMGTLCSTIGCTSAQVQTVETDIAKVLEAAIAALDKVNNNPAAISEAESALSSLAAIAPQTGTIHQAIVDAQAALVALQRNQGTLVAVQVSLQTVVNLLENQGTIPMGKYRIIRSSTKAN